MRLSRTLPLATSLVATLTGVLASVESHDVELRRPSHLSRRQDQPVATEEQQIAIYYQAFTDPVGAAKAANALPYIAGQAATSNLYTYNIGSDNAQLPWNQGVYFEPEAAVNGSVDGGWESLPNIAGFNLNRTMVVKDGAIMPFYATANYDSSKIKRAVMIMPGRPRDCWKYTSLVQNALSVEVTNSSSGVTNDSVLVIGPCWMNTDDRRAGATLDDELVWYGSQWQRGGGSRGPGNANISTYEVLDFFLDTLFDKAQFPALNRVVVAGHSMGAQMVQRYAMVKDDKSYDPNVAYWVGNPGSYAWPVESRPQQNQTCQDADVWPYGLTSGPDDPDLFRSALENDRTGVVDLYRSRNVHYMLGLLDNGAGDTKCQAGEQGANHLERGAQMVQALGAMQGGFPQNHTVNLIPRVSHQYYSMLSYNISLWKLFADGLDTAAASSPAGSRTSSRTSSSGSSGNGGLVNQVSVPLALGAAALALCTLL